jgi:ADP-ribosylation factor 2-binding protein
MTAVLLLVSSILFSLDKSKEEILVEVYSKKDQDFDLTVEALQDILLSDEFTTVHDGFLEQNYHHFEDTEENKHIYMDIYKAYTDTIERHIEDALMDRLPGFKMSDFLRSLELRCDEVDETILDMLHSFNDFLTFKQTFIDYKKVN